MEHKIYRKLKQDISIVKKTIGPKCHSKIKVILQNINKNLMALYKIAIKDTKTGLYNSRFFDAVFEIEIEKAKRGQKLSVIIIDIDNLKSVNDKLGHSNGDIVIKKVAKYVGENIRKSDIASRFGGDEFVILLPYASLKTAMRISRRLRAEIMSDTTFSEWGITASSGVADFEKGDTKNKLFNKADFALLCAKKQGKNISMSYKDV
ncbi:MAG: GGDEF domain-containing protein [archaeon]